MEDFGKIVAPTIRELFVERIASRILSGALKVGERLPSERALAEQMGIGKTVVHSGLQELARIGLVTIRPQSGVYVADYMVTGNLETFSAIVRFHGDNLRLDTVAAICDLRLAVEGLAMRRFAARCTPGDLQTLRAMIDQIGGRVASGTAGSAELAQLLFQFHQAICLMSRSAMLPLTMNAVQDVALTIWEKYLRVNSLENVLNLLEEFVACFARHDGDGAYALLARGVEEQLEKFRTAFGA